MNILSGRKKKIDLTNNTIMLDGSTIEQKVNELQRQVNTLRKGLFEVTTTMSDFMELMGYYKSYKSNFVEISDNENPYE